MEKTAAYLCLVTFDSFFSFPPALIASLDGLATVHTVPYLRGEKKKKAISVEKRKK